MAGAAALLGAGLAKLGTSERAEAAHTSTAQYDPIHSGTINYPTSPNGTSIWVGNYGTQNPADPRYTLSVDHFGPAAPSGISDRIAVRGTVNTTGAYSAGVEGIAKNPTGLTRGVSGMTASMTTNATGVFGSATATTGITVGTWGETSSTTANTSGVYGIARGASGTTVGVWGRSQSPSGKGVFGESSATTGQTTGVGGQVSSTGNYAIGVNGAALGTTGESYGVAGSTMSATTNATGVKGVTYSGLTYGVWGQTFSTSTSAIGVFGQAAGATGDTYGVWGRSQSSSQNAIGVYGHVPSSSNGTGVHGSAQYGAGVKGVASGGSGVRGESSFGYGVSGIANGSAAGVYGTNTASGPAAHFVGPVIVQGSFTVTGGAKSAAVKKKDGSLARVYCQESPEPWFEDFGTAELKGGQASVALDPEFDEVVKGDDYRVFLTEIGDCGGLYISRTAPHRFEVKSRAGAAANGSFYYRIVARRGDPVGGRLEKVAAPVSADPKGLVVTAAPTGELPGTGKTEQPKPERVERPEPPATMPFSLPTSPEQSAR